MRTLLPADFARNREAIAYLAIGSALSAAYFVVPAGPNMQHVIYEAIGLSAVAAIWRGNLRHRSGPPWTAMLIGIALWVGGDSFWNAYRWITGNEAPFPSGADVFYLLAYLPLLLAIALLVRGGRPRASDLVDASIVGLAAGLVVWFAAIAPSAAAHHSSTLTGAITVIYPTMDYLLLLGVVQLAFVGGLRNTALRWATAAFATVLVTDIIYARMRVDASFTATSYVNIGYFAFYVLLGAAALSPAVREPIASAKSPYGRLTLGRMALLFVERDELDVARREAQQALKQIAYHDGLTQLANRRSLYEAIAEAIAAGGGGTALLFVDLDGFKAVNDEYGHMAGDAVLAEVAGRLRRAVRGEDLVARHGGDEFVVLLRRLPQDQAGELAVQAADRVRAALADPIDTPVAQFSITASIGSALHPRDGTSPDQLIRVADDRMYQSKRSARAA